MHRLGFNYCMHPDFQALISSRVTLGQRTTFSKTEGKIAFVMSTKAGEGLMETKGMEEKGF